MNKIEVKVNATNTIEEKDSNTVRGNTLENNTDTVYAHIGVSYEMTISHHMQLRDFITELADQLSLKGKLRIDFKRKLKPIHQHLDLDKWGRSHHNLKKIYILTEQNASNKLLVDTVVIDISITELPFI